MAGATPWEAGRFDERTGAKRILFGRMYEDSSIEQEAFAPGSRVFCIASAGCTAMTLAHRHLVTAVDINPVQLAYAEARAGGGPMRAGSAETILNLGRRLLSLSGWRRRTIETFLDLEDPEQQIDFWNRRLDTRRFRLAMNVLLSASWLKLAYASPFLDFLPARFGRMIRARLERCWRTHPNRTNPYARDLLFGGTPRPMPIAALRPIRFACEDAAAFLERGEPGSFDAFTLSNVLDGAPAAYRERLLEAVRRAASPDAIVVLRSVAEPERESPTNLASRDRSILWGVVDVRRASSL